MTDAAKAVALEGIVEALMSGTERSFDAALTVARLKREHGAKWIEAYVNEKGRDDG